MARTYLYSFIFRRSILGTTLIINEFCRQAVGTPFVPDGDDFNGWDCWGLLRSFYKHCMGIELTNYRTKPIEDSFETEIVKWKEIKDDVKPGDGILMRGEPFHVAVVISRNKMLHVTVGADTTLEDFTSVRWRHQIVGFYRRENHV